MDRDETGDGGTERPLSMTKTQRRHWRRKQNRKKRMDRDGSGVGAPSQGAHGGTTTPKEWDQMTVAQRQNWHKHRRKKEIKARLFCAIVVLLPSMGAAARRRRQAFARPVVGPPQYSPCFECPRLDSYVSIKTSSN